MTRVMKKYLLNTFQKHVADVCANKVGVVYLLQTFYSRFGDTCVCKMLSM